MEEADPVAARLRPGTEWFVRYRTGPKEQRKAGLRRGAYFFEAPAAFLADLLREEGVFPGDVLPPRVSRRVSGITFGSWSAAELTTWINQGLMLSPLAAAATATAR